MVLIVTSMMANTIADPRMVAGTGRSPSSDESGLEGLFGFGLGGLRLFS
jgi:hypothetical protein